MPLSTRLLRSKLSLPGVVAFDHCRLPLRHFAFNRREDSISKLHRLALEVDRLAPQDVSAKAQRTARFTYFFVCLAQIARTHAEYGRHVRKVHRVSHLRQLRDLWHCMWVNNQFARHYYWRKLFLEPNREAWLHKFEHREITTLLDFFNRQLPFHRVANKIEFSEHCQAHDIPTPEILMAWQDGRPIKEIPADPEADVFIKPVSDFGSLGAQAIAFDRSTCRYQIGGKMLFWDDLITEIGNTVAAGKGYIMQRRIRNAVTSAVFGQDDICNLRIVTGRPLNGSPEVIVSVMRVPSTYTRGGSDRQVIFSTVDTKTARMSKGVFRNITMPQFTHHPDTGHKIEGRLVPRWSTMVDLVTRAHATYPWMPFIGWDVVDSDQGVLLLEANAYWGADSAQLPGAPGLGDTRFCEIYLEWFQAFKEGRLPLDILPDSMITATGVSHAA